MNAWSGLATRAAVDRLAAGRPIDPAFVAQLEVDAVTTVRQGGGSDAAVRTALDGIHDGLYVALTQRPTGNRPSQVTSAILPALSPQRRLHGSNPSVDSRHKAAQRIPRSLYGPTPTQEAS